MAWKIPPVTLTQLVSVLWSVTEKNVALLSHTFLRSGVRSENLSKGNKEADRKICSGFALTYEKQGKTEDRRPAPK